MLSSSLLSRTLIRCCPALHARASGGVTSSTVATTRAMSARSIMTSSSLWSDQSSRKVMREPPVDSLLSFSVQFYRHPSAPIVVGWVDLEATRLQQQRKQNDIAPTNDNNDPAPLQAMNRNARMPKRANRGKRAVSRQARRAKKRAIGNHRR